uniref:Uncharacterized protein n=1 Tax=Rhizophora mucronata TaxID=61149 RepID=A0A2P2NRT6_RHIMU
MMCCPQCSGSCAALRFSEIRNLLSMVFLKQLLIIIIIGW